MAVLVDVEPKDSIPDEKVTFSVKPKLNKRQQENLQKAQDELAEFMKNREEKKEVVIKK